MQDDKLWTAGPSKLKIILLLKLGENEHKFGKYLLELFSSYDPFEINLPYLQGL